MSRLSDVSDCLLWRELDLYVHTARFYEDFSEIRTIGLDGTSVAKGHEYITLFVDMEKKRIIHISDGKGSETIEDFAEHLEAVNGSCNAVTNVSNDRSPACVKGVGKYLHNTSITFDKFHILKEINEAVDEVQCQEVKNNPLLKGTRYKILKNGRNLTKKNNGMPNRNYLCPDSISNRSGQ